MKLKASEGYENIPYYFEDATDLKPTGKINKADQVEVAAIGHKLKWKSGYQTDKDGNQILCVPKHLLEEEPERDQIKLENLQYT